MEFPTGLFFDCGFAALRYIVMGLYETEYN